MAKRIIITCGDPAGIGPEITISALSKLPILKKAEVTLIGDEAILRRVKGFDAIRRRITFIDIKTRNICGIKRGKISKTAGRAALSYLETALAIAKKEQINRIVTAPVSKEAIKLTYPEFSGHTEYLAGFYKRKNVVMLMYAQKIKVVLATRHINLSEVSKAITRRLIYNSLRLTYKELRRVFGINRPRIAVLSVNPHAGINTFLGAEEKKISRAAAKLNKDTVKGPYPADTIFTPKNLKKYDCFFCAYHDQGMIPFKLLAFDDGVNVTLGLPVIRTSPAHGVAFDLIRQNKQPSSSSMLAAIKLALKVSN